MMINRILTAASAAALGLTMATSAMAIPIDEADIGLGFGKFLGTWQSNPPGSSDMPNPSESNVEEVGEAILIAHPGLFDIDEFHLAGLADEYQAGPTNTNLPGTGFRVDSKLDAYTAKWTYDGFADAGIFPPGDDPVDLYIAVKYGTFVSVFKYDVVNPGDFGYLSSDYADILAHTADGDEAGLNYSGFTSDCDLGADNFSASCMKYNTSGNSPLGVSHVTAYWPPVAADVPEPASMTLLGAGLLGLGYLRRRRQAS